MTEIILGPPGTGKTTTLVGLVEEELSRGTAPDRIGYVSFTKRAAEEARRRACARFQLREDQLPYFSTLHALCYRQLGLRSDDVLSGKRLFAFANYARIRLKGGVAEDGTMAGFEPGERAMFMENLARIRCMPLEKLYGEDHDDLQWPFVLDIARRLRVYKTAHQLLDYTDMLTEFLRSGGRPRLEVLIVDEGQDLSHLQWLVVEALAAGCRRVAVAGDDDQAIYKWAGADVQHLIEMQGDVSVLGQSWRVPPAVQAVAAKLTRHMGRRREKEWRARQDSRGEVRRLRSLADLEVTEQRRGGRPPIMILARNTYILKTRVEPWLRERGMIYERSGHSSLNMDMMRAIRDWEHMRKGNAVSGATARGVLRWMSVGSGFRHGSKTLPGVGDEDEITLRELRDTGRVLREDEWFNALDQIPDEDKSYVRSVRRKGDSLSEPRVAVSTIHGVKGGEAEHVVLLTEMAWRTHREMEKSPADEARVWYVAVTRARERLTIVHDENQQRSCEWL